MLFPQNEFANFSDLAEITITSFNYSKLSWLTRPFAFELTDALRIVTGMLVPRTLYR
ncbi:MAG: hypothetical protein U5J96_15810 [Ignavibacteriaceae bacterium]|nr:hypothetical protein [Ignavibacteriaceae bacterium]